MKSLTKNTIQTCCESNLVKLTDEQLRQFVFKSKQILRSPAAKIIFRGESNSNIRKQYKIASEQVQPLDIAKFLFLIGEKGKHFWNGIPLPFEIMDTGQEPAQYIWDNISCILKENNISKPLFSEETSDKFIKEIEKLDDNKKKELLFDYYYSYIHTYRSKNSHYLSTSESIHTALSFLGKKPGIIIIGWVPESNYNKMVIKYEDTCEYREDICSWGFPIFDTLYPKQKEICLKCGILPHFIIGFYIPTTNSFIVNPNLFKDERNINDIITEGFNVDQSEFLTELKNTGYNKCYWYYKGIYTPIPNE